MPLRKKVYVAIISSRPVSTLMIHYGEANIAAVPIFVGATIDDEDEENSNAVG